MGWGLRIGHGAALPAWVSALPLWQWYEIPNTALSSVAPSPTPGGITGPKSKIDAYCGATLKRAGSVYLIVAAGGHGDYFGNEGNALALGVETPAWTQLLAPTPASDVINATSVYLDYRRSSIHTYCNTQFYEAGNRVLLLTGGGPNSVAISQAADDWPWLTGEHPAVQSAAKTESKPHMAFDLGANAWTAPDELAPIPAGVGGSSAICCTNQQTGEIYAKAGGWDLMKKYDPATDTWSAAGNAGYAIAAGSAIDPTRRRMLIVGSNGGGVAPRIFDLDTGALASVTFGGIGTTALTAALAPGVIHDPENDCYLVAVNGATSSDPIELYRVEAGTLEVSLLTDVGTKPLQRATGIWNSMQHAPELKGLVMANKYTGNVKFMRTAA